MDAAPAALAPSSLSSACVCLAAALGWTQPALAGRVLEEGPLASKVVQSAPRSDLEKALRSAALGEQCPRSGLRQLDLNGVRCRATLSAALLRARPLAKTADLQARTELFADLSQTANSVSSWEPLSPPPGLGRARFDAHAALAGALMNLYDDILAAKGQRTLAGGVAAWLEEVPDPKTIACQVAQRSVELATGADAVAEERGGVQALLTAHACFLDESRLRGAPRAVSGPRPDAGDVPAVSTAEEKIQSYATTRRMDLERCTKHLDAAGAPADTPKLEKCACGAIGRWKLPNSETATTTSLAVSARVDIGLEVNSSGAVSRCGPLSVKP